MNLVNLCPLQVRPGSPGVQFNRNLIFRMGLRDYIISVIRNFLVKTFLKTHNMIMDLFGDGP